jgi:hypothetical protein
VRWSIDVDAAALELYGLTPDELAAARNAMAKATKDDAARQLARDAQVRHHHRARRPTSTV